MKVYELYGIEFPKTTAISGPSPLMGCEIYEYDSEKGHISGKGDLSEVIKNGDPMIHTVADTMETLAMKVAKLFPFEEGDLVGTIIGTEKVSDGLGQLMNTYTKTGGWPCLKPIEFQELLVKYSKKEVN